MSVKIRLSRGGRKKMPFYHVVVADDRSPRDGRYIEKLGYYNPNAPKDSDQRLVWNTERVNHWLSVGAQPTETVGLWVMDQKLGGDRLRAKLEKVLNRRKDIVAKRLAEKKAAEEAAKAAEEAEAAAAAAAEAAEAASAEAPAE